MVVVVEVSVCLYESQRPAVSAGSAEREKIVAAAVLCTLGSVTVPSLASVYNEFALKQHMDTSVHEQARASATAPCVGLGFSVGFGSDKG